MIPKVRTLSSGILYYRGLNQQPLYFKPRCLTTSLLSPFKCWFFPKSLPSQPIYSENTTVSAMSITGEWATRVSITLLSRRAFIRMRVHLLPGPAEQIETLNKGFLLFPQVRNNQPLILSASSTLRGSKRSLERWITYGEKKKKTLERECASFFSENISLRWEVAISWQLSNQPFWFPRTLLPCQPHEFSDLALLFTDTN